MGIFSPLNEPMRSWQGRKVWLVGASSGIGAALALELARRGARLALSARRHDRLQDLAARCAGGFAGGAPGALPPLVAAMDVRRPEDIARALGLIMAEWGGLDLVVFNAGTYRPQSAWDLTSASIRETLETNLVGTMDGVATVLPQLLRQGNGAIAIVASVAGFGGLPRASVYGPSKAALINFAETLYLDLAPRGIGVFLVAPGFVATPLTAQNTFHMPALISPELAAEAIIDGFARGSFEIHFPKRFTLILKLLQCFPRRLYFPLVRRATGLHSESGRG